METSESAKPQSSWIECTTVHDKAVAGLFGLEMFDMGVLVALVVGLFLLRIFIWHLSPLIMVIGLVVSAVALYKGKHGKPRGAIQHWLHEQTLLPLPGVLPPGEQEFDL